MCSSLNLTRILKNWLLRNKRSFAVLLFLAVSYKIVFIIVQIAKYQLVCLNERQYYEHYEHVESPTQNRPNIVHAENENMHIGQGTKHMEHLHQKIYGVIPLEQRNILDIPAEQSNQHKVKQENKHIEQNDKPTKQTTENEATKMPWFSLKLVDPITEIPWIP